ncbi:30S ribosomal protein S11-like [Ostrea edulis]|uniref:30S ribosomal protein S11-like n=1 Tax=Ostrea edulis TaxID=37623 RepID=UPI002094C4DC|nr:30S ribosomal protein S11-like [Ostrea edulis]XP_048734614.1 30S ribosomal protein S11-like [Ostrea edulis]XP_056022962.1 30S ribosomal protein S11-like [Ostrea edulis]
MLRSLISSIRQTYTCVVRPNIASVNHQVVCHFNKDVDARDYSPGDEQHDKRLWRRHFPSEETLQMSIDGTPYDQLPVVNIKTSKNNVIISLCRGTGETICLSSGGSLGFRHAKKNTNLCAQTVGAHIGEKAKSLGLQNLRVNLNGLNTKRTSALLGLRTSGVRIVSISDVTKTPHNGCRPRSKPRK